VTRSFLYSKRKHQKKNKKKSKQGAGYSSTLFNRFAGNKLRERSYKGGTIKKVSEGKIAVENYSPINPSLKDNKKAAKGKDAE